MTGSGLREISGAGVTGLGVGGLVLTIGGGLVVFVSVDIGGRSLLVWLISVGEGVKVELWSSLDLLDLKLNIFDSNSKL